LKNLGLIETKILGLPTIRHIRVDFKKLKIFLENHGIEIKYAPTFNRDYIPKEREKWEIGQMIYKKTHGQS